MNKSVLHSNIQEVKQDLWALEKIEELFEEPYIRCNPWVASLFTRMITGERESLNKQLDVLKKSGEAK